MTAKETLNARTIEKIEEVTVEFLSEALSIPGIVSFTSHRIGTGQVGEVHRLFLNYGPEDAGPEGDQERPPTVILKIPSPNARSRASAVSLGIYEYEARFYTELAPGLPEAARASVPACRHAGFDPETVLGSLVLEDAGLGAVAGDDLRGARRAEALLAMRALGRLHGALRPALLDPARAAWLVREPDANGAFFHEIFLAFRARYGDRVAPDHMTIIERWIPAFDWFVEQQLASPPDKVGVRHGDFRLDNLIYLGGGRIKVVDWQCIAAGPLVGDVAYFLGCSLTTENRRAWQDDLLKEYCDALAEASPPEFGPTLTLEQVRHELRLQTLGSVTMSLVSSIMVDPTERGDDMFMTLIARECELVKDVDALALLPALPPPDPTPLRPLAADEHPHPVGPSKYWNESWYFDFVDEAQGVAGWVRMGMTPRMRGNWYTATFTRRGEGVYVVEDYAAPKVVSDEHGLHLTKPGAYDVTHEAVEELETYRIRLSSGAATYYEDATNVLLAAPPSSTGKGIELDLSFHTAGVPYHYRISTRYEIPCTVTGSVTVDETSIALNSVYGQRDHSWAARDWWAMDWLWSSFYLSPKDGGGPETRIHATELRWPGRPSMCMGYVQTGSDIQEIEGLECQEDIVPRSGPSGEKTRIVTSMRMVVRAHEKDEMWVQVEPQGHAPLKLVSDDGRVSMFDRAWGKVKMPDGREGVGWFEWNMNVWD